MIGGRDLTNALSGAATLAVLGAGLVLLGPGSARGGEKAASGVAVTPRQDRPPRKVIVGTSVERFWGTYPGLEARLEQLGRIVDEMAAEAQRKYSRRLDVAALPEMAVTGGREGNAAARSLPFAGPVQDAFAALARKHRCYIAVPLELLEDAPTKRCYNACVVMGRNGETLGTYRKVHPAVQLGTENMEGGMSPGREVPVFECDFGRLGVQMAGVVRRRPVEAVLLIADVLDRGANQGLQAVDDRLGEGFVLFLGVARLGGADLAGQHDALGRHQGFAGDAGLGVLGQEGVDDGVRDAVGDLVRVSFGHAFRGEEEGGTSGQERLLSVSGVKAYKHMLICSSDVLTLAQLYPRPRSGRGAEIRYDRRGSA